MWIYICNLYRPTVHKNEILYVCSLCNFAMEPKLALSLLWWILNSVKWILCMLYSQLQWLRDAYFTILILFGTMLLIRGWNSSTMKMNTLEKTFENFLPCLLFPYMIWKWLLIIFFLYNSWSSQRCRNLHGNDIHQRLSSQMKTKSYSTSFSSSDMEYVWHIEWHAMN